MITNIKKFLWIISLIIGNLLCAQHSVHCNLKTGTIHTSSLVREFHPAVTHHTVVHGISCPSRSPHEWARCCERLGMKMP